ncbi:peptidyl-prolyl cis-trans isomerase B-like [Penaeus chinensis]|uniref:peptidyl-prolyl cis-trans isomerase B-like n=1 Tax=Penaeus chinensis TaxID=139456 RepID=UPI001FB6F934|nr:peptidyl-prolyl cis-trans isomerase B-like [Penaeus chinensis]
MKIRLPKFSLLRMFVCVIIVPTGMVLITIATMHHDPREYKVTHEVFLELEADGKPMGTVVVGLFGDTVPRTVKNFITFASKGYAGFKYEGTPIHRVIKKFMIQGGDVATGDGKGSISIYGESFPDENFEINHSGPGFVSMANRGKDTNGCQFFITTIATPWLNGHHVVFGKVVEGQPIVHQIEYMATDWNDRPLKDVRIAKSGRRSVKTPYYISDDPYNLKDWLKTISVPLGLSFCIIYVFNYFIKMLDRSIIPDDGSMEIEDTEIGEPKEGEKEKEEEGTKKKEEEKKEERKKPLAVKDEGGELRRRKTAEKK